MINTTLATEVNVDDLRLKRQRDPDALKRLIEEIKEAKANNHHAPMLCEGPNHARALIDRPPICPMR